MIAALRQFLTGRSAKPPPLVPPGERVYAVGDVHGRLDLLDALAHAIEEDDVGRAAATTTVVLLGDLVDRGPHSAAVIEYAKGWQSRRNVRIIAGNHEEMFLSALRKSNAFRAFLRIGGRETILSYGIDPTAFHVAELDEARAMAREAVPRSHLGFIEELEDQIRIGDYLFVHAGIRPGMALDDQRAEDLRWIREPFLTSDEDHGCVVVHGHTISEEVVVRHNRIGIDTGAFMSGRLTALALEGSRRWLIEAREHEDGEITTGVAPLIAPARRGGRKDEEHAALARVLGKGAQGDGAAADALPDEADTDPIAPGSL